MYYDSVNTFHHIAPLCLWFTLFLPALLTPTALAQTSSRSAALPKGIEATGDTTEVRALTAWAEEHRRTHPEQAQQTAEQALTLARELNDQRGIGWNLTTLGHMISSSDFHRAEAYYSEAQTIFEQIGDRRGLNDTRLGMGDVYMYRGGLEQAATYYFDALEGFRHLEDTEGQAAARNGIGITHEHQGNLEEALAYYQRAITLNETLGDSLKLVSTLNNAGNTLMNLGMYEEAESQFRRALAISEKRQARFHTAFLSNNLGALFNKQNRYEGALPLLFRAERLSRELEENVLLGIVYDEIGQAYLGLSQYDRALHYAGESLVIAQETGSLSNQMKVHQTLSRIYEAAGDDGQALAHHRQYAAMRDSLLNAEKAEIITEMETRYETEEKQRAIERLEQENQIQALRQILLIGGIVVALLIAGLFYNRYRIKQKANRLLEELDAAKSRFFANISHEFRTPLTLLLGPLQDQVNGSPPSQETAGAMLRSARRLERLIDQLLELERIDAGRPALHKNTVNLADFVRENIDTFNPLAQQKHIDLENETGTMLVPVHADDEYIGRVIGNLLSNAIKFTPAGGRVRVVLTSPPPKLIVEDTGPGIPPEWREHIFDRFAQMDGHATRDSEGAGLGLALSREIVSLHQGELFVEETAGGGARFVLQLPLAENKTVAKHTSTITAAEEKATFDIIAQTPEENGHVRQKSEGKPSTQPRVLVVEDQTDLRRYIASVLSTDYEVETAQDGDEALNAVRREPPDVIVSDIVMPRRDGFALARALRAEPEYAGIPLIFLTARTGDRDEIKGLAIGADQYLKKPFQRDVLLAHIAAALHTCRRLQEHLASLSSELDENRTEPNSLTERARAWIEENIHEESLSVEDMAASLHMSRTTLFRRLVAETGLPPSDLIRTTRLTRARRLLETSAGNVSEVAYAVGFGSLAAFSRAYRAHYGTPPSTHLGRDQAAFATSG